MADLNRGKEIFKNRVEYPLPERNGVKDYIFYFAKANDPYGNAARAFFKKFYEKHIPKDVETFEDLIDVLHAEVTTGRVQQIREIVIVAHGNSQALLHPILKSSTEAIRQNFKYLADISLARLQQALDGEFQSFRDKRKKVIAFLRADSWVTIRACNFGNSKKGMYATYSFFGGRANIYAPTMYQVFWSCPLVLGSRLETNKQAHRHMVMQHFLPRDTHSPERKDTIVSRLVDPALFAAPVEVASMPTTAPTPDEAERYNGVVDDLNAGKRSLFLDLPLSVSARVTVVRKNIAWKINDQIRDGNDVYKIEYQIYETVTDSGPGESRKTLWAQAKLPQITNKTFPIQLFLTRESHDKFSGILFDLAGYTDQDAESSSKTRFDAVLALLRSNKWTDGIGNGVNIGEVIKTKLAVDLLPQPRPKGPDRWSIDDKESYLIKLEHPSTPEGVVAHTITVYVNWDRVARVANQVYLLSNEGVNPDTPGTELPAYLDTLTIDELTSHIDYLRSPFKPGNSFYIHHAQQALVRKKEFPKWWAERNADELANPLVRDSYSMLILDESADLRETAYAADFNSIWSEVKASAPTTTAFREDLFTEEPLAQKLHISAEELSRSLPDLVSDSFTAVTVQDLSDFEKSFSTHPSASKRIFDESKEDPTANCKDFEAAIAKWKEAQNLEPDKIEKLLEEQKTSDGSSYFDVLLAAAKGYKFMRDLAKFVELLTGKLERYTFVPTSPGTFGREVAKRILTKQVEAEISWWFASEGLVLARTAWFQLGLGLLWSWSVISLPLVLLERFGEEWQKAEEAWEIIGKVTAMRQWLRGVEDVTYGSDHVPDLSEIDVSTPVSAMPFYKGRYPFDNEPYYIGRYFLEQVLVSGQYSPFIFAPDRIKAGFDRGVIAMQFKVRSELETRAQKGVDEVLQRWHLDSCKIEALRAAGLLDIGALKAHIMGLLATALRDRLPKP